MKNIVRLVVSLNKDNLKIKKYLYECVLERGFYVISQGAFVGKTIDKKHIGIIKQCLPRNGFNFIALYTFCPENKTEKYGKELLQEMKKIVKKRVKTLNKMEHLVNNYNK